ncbi:MAG: hypothetical protein MK098_06475 [Marinovum sp.]|nr:hypothetical protein [Marinovum sp.]
MACLSVVHGIEIARVVDSEDLGTACVTFTNVGPSEVLINAQPPENALTTLRPGHAQIISGDIMTMRIKDPLSLPDCAIITYEIVSTHHH